MTPSDLIEAFAAASGDSLVATDFDGTLSRIVAQPSAARPVDGAVQVLASLAETVGEVAVISGRPLSFLTQFLPTSITLVGLYGLESRRHGEAFEHPNSGVWRETMSDVATGAELHGPGGMVVELKDLSITLHYREHPDLATAVASYAATAADSAGLRVRPARMSVELHPPIDEDKGTSLSRLVDPPGGPVLFCGDDVGDLPAFDVIDRLAEQGRPAWSVAAQSSEVPDALLERASLVVDGPDGVLELLAALAAG